MSRIYIPTTGPESWKQFLADPEKHWRPGYSAHSLAFCWEKADGFPPEVAALFKASGIPAFAQMEMLLAFPEYAVPLPGGRASSQNDLFVMARDAYGDLVAIMVEGKVSEDFGELLADWGPSSTPGKTTRFAFLKYKLGLTDIPGNIRYQLLHRTASAIIEAERFNAPSAVMLVHSFSQDDEHFDDYWHFVSLFHDGTPTKDLIALATLDGTRLYTGWVTGQ